MFVTEVVKEFVVEQWDHAFPLSEQVEPVVVTEVVVPATLVAEVVAEAEVLLAAAAVVEAAAAALVTA